MESKAAMAAAMACSASDKIKASARELMKNLDTWRRDDSSTSLESAIQKMFGSCTSATELKCEPGNDEDDEPLVTDSERLMHGSWKDRVVSPEPVFQMRSPKTEYGEHIYAQLFFDDQKRASRAVDSLREQEPCFPPNDVTPSPQHKNLQRPFPVSSPERATISRLTNPRPTPIASGQVCVPTTGTFDDGISAISAYTLEAMVQAQHEKLQKVASEESSLFPSSSRETPPRAVENEPLSPHQKPQLHPTSTIRRSGGSFGRSRSNQTSETPATKESHNSKTTRTTESSNFELMWANNEQKYWTSEVQNDKSTRLIPRGSLSKRAKSVGSRKTVSTSSQTTPSSFAHPHDTITFEAQDFVPSPDDRDIEFTTAFARDPDRIDQVLVLPVETEMAEI